MPKLMDDANMTGGSCRGFSFSGVRPEKLGATEYTLVTVAMDKTGSVSGFEDELLACVKAAVDSCKASPRSENLLVRFVTFNGRIDEEHGFKPLADIDSSAYARPRCGGGTALYDALFASASATNDYAKTLADYDFLANGIIFVITDGDDNESSTNPSLVRQEIERGVAAESLESMVSVLIGVNAGRFGAKLDMVRSSCGLSQFVDAGDASPKNLAKLADFVSRSISSQSQSLGTGGPSAPLTI